MKVHHHSTSLEAMEQLAARHSREKEYHDLLASHPDRPRARCYEWGLEEEAERFAMSLLGPLDGRTILDFGCGTGRFSVAFARQGARVLAFDLSGGTLDAAVSRARKEGLRERILCQRMSGEQLAYATGSIDLIYGQSILHHLNLEVAHREILRVLAPGGRAVFLEPLIHNPFIQLYRRLTPSQRSPDERPFSAADVRVFGEGFRKFQHWEFCLLALLAVPLTLLPSEKVFHRALRFLRFLDRPLLRLFPFLRRNCWIAVIQLEK